MKKDGELSSRDTSAITKEQFENLQKYTDKIIKQISQEILSGNIDIKPYYNTKDKRPHVNIVVISLYADLMKDNAIITTM